MGTARPNILLLVSDDQTLTTFSRDLMPQVYADMVDRGVLFDRAYDSTGLCCPSRSQIMTGLWEHHTGVDSNTTPLLRPTIIQALHDAGYRTGLSGKYLNSELCNPHPGFDDWHCTAAYSYTNPHVNDNGTQHKLTGYTTDILAQDAVNFIQSTPAGQPWFEMYTPASPHLPANDPRCTAYVPPLRDPGYYDDTMTDGKPGYMQRGPYTDAEAAVVDGEHQAMTDAVECLDGSMGTVLNALDANPSMEQNTIVFYLSDNGYLYGEHRRDAKSVPYEEAVKVPFIVRAPMLHSEDQPETTEALVGNVDIAPTIADLAGFAWGADGLSLRPLLDGSQTTIRDSMLIAGCEGATALCAPGQSTTGDDAIGGVPSFYGVVTSQYKYVEYETGESELYDYAVDPYEITNLVNDPGYAEVVTTLQAQLQALEAPPPVETTIVSGPPSVLDGRVATFVYMSQDRHATYACRLTQNGSVVRDWFACNGQGVTLGGLTDGSYLFEVTGTDALGSTDPTPASRSFTITSTGTDAEVTTHPLVAQQSNMLSFGFGSQTPGAHFSCSLEPLGTQPSFTSCDSSSGASYGPLADGDWDFQVLATHGSEFTSIPAEWLTHVDNVGPQMIFDVPLDVGGTLQNNSTIKGDFHSSETLAGAPSCTLDGVSLDCSLQHIFVTGEADGTHPLFVTAADTTGNIGVTTFVYTLDTRAPVVTITTHPSDPTTKTSATFKYSADESAAFTCSLDGGDYKQCSNSKTYKNLADGQHTFCVIGTDPAGNASASTCWTWTVDTTGPVITFTAGPANPTNQRSATFSFTANVPVTGYTCSLDGGAFVSCTSPATYRVAEGSHSLTVDATDTFGQTGSAVYPWTVDITKPSASITSMPPNPTNQTTATFAFSSNDPTATATCTLGSRSGSCAGTITYRSLTTGKRKFTVKFTDPAGNVGHASYSWTIDLTAPVVTFDSTPPNPSPGTVSFGFHASETSTFMCTMDGGLPTSCVSGVTYTGLADGLHTFQVTPTDTAGNVGLPASFTWTVANGPHEFPWRS